MSTTAVPNPPKITRRPVHNRLPAICAHTTRYAFQGETKLARDCGISRSALSRVMTGQSSPSFALITEVTNVLEKYLGKQIDPREIVSMDGTYPTESVCELVGCSGCMPDEAYDNHENLRPQFRTMHPGQWNGSIAPRRQVIVAGEVQ